MTHPEYPPVVRGLIADTGPAAARYDPVRTSQN
jgi:hypothetical protein